jgi:hypothetical protein
MKNRTPDSEGVELRGYGVPGDTDVAGFKGPEETSFLSGLDEMRDLSIPGCPKR